MAKCFLDTNVLFYALDSRDSLKQTIAIDLLTEVSRSGEGCISSQVAMELSANLIKKLGVAPPVAKQLVEGLEAFNFVPLELETVQRGLELMTSASVSFWDATILAAAERSGCRILFSEDLSHGQMVAGLQIVNPFVHIDLGGADGS